MDSDTGVEMELEETMPLLEWLANNYKTFGAALEIITDRSGMDIFEEKKKKTFFTAGGRFSVEKS